MSTPDPWADITPDDARALRAEDIERATGTRPLRMPQGAYSSMAHATSRADRLAIIADLEMRRQRRVKAWSIALWCLIAGVLAAGLIALALTTPVAGVG